MTGIHLPPGLAQGQTLDPQQLRTALVIDKLATLPPVPAATESNVQNSTGQAIRNSQQAGGANGVPAQSALLPGTSTRESLSAAARVILAVMDSTEAQPVRSAGPLLTSPANAQQAATVLASTVSQSGLFYESHLAQWVSGARPLPEIRQEPQAQVPLPGRANMPTTAAQAQAGSPSALLTYSGAGASPEPARAAMPALIPASQVLAEALAAPGNPRVAHSHAAAEQGLRQGNGSTLAYSRDAAEPSGQRPSAAAFASQAYQATADAAARAAAPDARVARTAAPEAEPASADAGRQAAPPPGPGPAIHPATEGVVRQQLELLATQQFRFAGEAWPGVPMNWVLQRADADGGAPAQDEAAQPWTSRLRLQLPVLGAVEAVLTLGPDGLDARIATTENDIAARFIEARPLLRSQLEARGIVLQRLSVQTQDSLAAEMP